MSSHASNRARVIPLRPRQGPAQAPGQTPAETRGPVAAAKEPLWRHVVGDVLRRRRLDQERTLKDVAEAARISMPYLSEVERGRKEASSEVLAAAARALGLGLADLLALTQGELASAAGARPVGRGPVPVAVPAAHGAQGAQGRPAAPGAAEDTRTAEAGEADDGVATSSVTELRSRHGATQAGSRPGEVRLAA